MNVVLAQLITGSAASSSWGGIPLAGGLLKAMAHGDSVLRDLPTIEIMDECYTRSEADEDKVVKRILLKQPDVLGLSLYCWNLMPGLSLARKVKEQSPATKVVVGGAEVFPDNKHIWNSPDIDIMVIGEGERTFVDILNHYLHGAPVLAEITGVFYRHEGTIHVNPPRQPIMDLDSIPSPYLLGYIKPTSEFMWLPVGRGCPHRCKFCCEWTARKGQVSYFSTERIQEELRIASEIKARVVKLEIPTFNAHRKKMREICDALKAVNTDNAMAFAVELRADAVDEDTAKLLSSANIRYAELGLETIHSTTLGNINREHNLTRYLEGIRLLHDAGIHCGVNLLLGLPGDTLEMLTETFRFLVDNSVDKMADVNYNIVSIGPGTALRAQAEEYGIEYQERPPYWVTKTKTITAKEIRRAIFLFQMYFPG